MNASFKLILYSLVWGFLVVLPQLPNGTSAATVNGIIQQLRRNCAKNSALDSRLYGAQKANADSAAWMALLYLPDDLILCRCSASLITGNFVLTAAHCWEICPRRQELRVCLGSHSVASPSHCLVSFGIERSILHPDFNLFQQINDIALLKLDRWVQNTGFIKTICLPLDYALMRETSFMNRHYKAFGWGEMEGGSYPTALMEIRVQSTPCRYHTYGLFFCTTSHRVDTCRGDSGGPLIREIRYAGGARSTQFGIVSHSSNGFKCGLEGGAFNTNVSLYMPWIVERLAEHTPPILERKCTMLYNRSKVPYRHCYDVYS